MTSNAWRFLSHLSVLAVISGVLSGLGPVYALEKLDVSEATVTLIYLWPGTLFGLFIVLYLKLRGVFEGARGWLMVVVSTLSFPATLFAGELFDETLGLSETLALPLGAGLGSLFFMAGAAWLSRIYRNAMAVAIGTVSGGILMLAATLWGNAFPGPDRWVLVTAVVGWQLGFALTLGLLATWRARQAGLSSAESYS